MKGNSRIGKWLLPAISLILATSSHAYAGGYQCSDSLKTDIENIERAKAKPQGTFVRLDKSTLKFEGYIDRGTYKEYLEAIDDEVRTLVINSAGGDTYDGVRIGLDMAKRNIDVIVDGMAASSGANYLFTAGKRKTICRGFVGFHGNNAALDRKALEESIRSASAKIGTSREQIEEAVRENLAVMEATKKLEKEFFAKLGISQELFDMTQEDAKGLSQKMNLNFDFLLPSIRTMEKFGIRNVEGRQDIELAERFGKTVIYY
ncbi:MAG TPA: ATP-dependent Clp protease proteolytic subunit [Thermodesulfovibrionales bacterium]|nr:ATP-dependent Clp protease proteolytic subunit [Thermodesulfovibrionales bacterium]